MLGKEDKEGIPVCYMGICSREWEETGDETKTVAMKDDESAVELREILNIAKDVCRSYRRRRIVTRDLEGSKPLEPSTSSKSCSLQ